MKDTQKTTRDNGGPFATAEQDEVDAWMKAFSGGETEEKVTPSSDTTGSESKPPAGMSGDG